MSAFWVNELASYPSAPSSMTIAASDSVAASIFDRTIISSSPTQIPPRFSSFMFRPSNASSVENTPSLILKAPVSNRVSFFTSKFRLFKARRTTTSNTFADPNQEIGPSAVQEANVAGSQDKSKDERAPGVRSHRAMTVPTHMGSPPSPPLVGLGLVGLEYDSRENKYWFRDSPRTPSSGMPSVLGRLGSEGSFGSNCPSPKTPSSVTGSFAASKDVAPEKDDEAKLETQLKEMLKYGMDEVDPAAMAGILAVLFPPCSPADQRQQSSGEDLSQSDSHRPEASVVRKDSETVDPSGSEPEDGLQAFAYLVQSPDKVAK